MSAKPATPVETATLTVPDTQYGRFLAVLPESFRQECRSKLDGRGFEVNHPVFLALTELYLEERKKPARNFILEATLHADQSTHLLNELKALPEAIMGKIESQITGVVSALNNPLQRLDAIATAMERPDKSPPALPPPESPGEQTQPIPSSRAAQPEPLKKECTAGSTFSNPMAWIVAGSISAAFAAIIFSLGAAHLAHAYEAAYLSRVARMEADSANDTVALNRLLVAGINLKVEQSPDRQAWYLILPGARKAAQPVNSPEGLAVEVWP